MVMACVQDVEFSRSFMEFMTTRWPRTMDTKKVRGPLAALEAKLAEVRAAASADATKERHQLL
jgi:hypothetical protein